MDKKEFLINEIHRWIKEHNGKIPARDSMKVSEGYPSSYQYGICFGTRKWNEILEKIGLQLNNKFWTEKEIKFLQDNWKELSDEQMSEKLNKQVGGIKYKRQELGLYRAPQKQFWEDWEIEYLHNNFYDALQEEIEKTLSNRNWETIRSYATKTLKLNRARFAVDNINENDFKQINYNTDIPIKHKKAWTKEDDDYILENWASKSDEELAKYLGRTPVAVKKHRQSCLKLYKNINENQHGEINNSKLNKNKIILLSKDKKLRICKVCKEWLPNTEEYFYKDKNGLRTKCKTCDLKIQNYERVASGSITQKMIQKMLRKGLSYCCECNTWKSLEHFTIFANNSRISSYCSDCNKIIYAKRYYGEENIDKYFENIEKYADKNGDRCDSLPEQLITNWLIDSNINYKKHPLYNQNIKDDKTRRKFDWIIFDDNKNKYFVEYFGYWSKQSNSFIVDDYVKSAKKKIRDLYKAGMINKCIFIFPDDLKNKTLDEIFEPILKNKKSKIA